uniref:hypothetical protein n=1 Tax=Salmonella sp. TaxID=599 RepID=UPI001CD9ABE8
MDRPRRSSEKKLTSSTNGANKEVRLRNAYAIKAERGEKMPKGNITTIFCTYDADTFKARSGRWS